MSDTANTPVAGAKGDWNFSKLLVANRGEIARRIMRTAKRLGMQTIAVYSDADADSPHVHDADISFCLGGTAASESYLRIDKILAAIAATGADAVHPGYGFLSENADFVAALDAAGVRFVGPSVEAMAVMGDKARARKSMLEAGIPCIPGYDGDAQDEASLIAAAQDIGLPLMIKAAAGGGGRGMRVVHDFADLPEGIARARSEALSAFGADHLILERALINPRHVEVQVFGDSQGNLLYVGDRDCSAQRRNQKVIEEAPAPGLSSDLRQRMGQAAVDVARTVDYTGAGTVEFLLTPEGEFFFLEMNTRLQVEHPVTELVTGLDLVEWQLRVANGAPLPCKQDDITISGHAVEARLYAEDPSNDFLPSSGTGACLGASTRWQHSGG